MIAQPIVRKALCISPCRSNRTLNLRNWCSQLSVRSTTHRYTPRTLPWGVPRFASTGEMWRRRPDIGIGEVTQVTAVRWSPVAAPGKANGARKVSSRVHLGRAGVQDVNVPKLDPAFDP